MCAFPKKVFCKKGMCDFANPLLTTFPVTNNSQTLHKIWDIKTVITAHSLMISSIPYVVEHSAMTVEISWTEVNFADFAKNFNSNF